MSCADANGSSADANRTCADFGDKATDSRITALKKAMAGLPLVSAHLPGIGGTIKARAEDFQVEEVLPYAPCGQGEHLYVTIRRKGWNTTDLADALARCLAINPRDVGWGGRKDKLAVCTQTFSIPIPTGVPPADIQERLKDLPVELLALQRHGNKIKTGHVSANRFRILVSALAPDTIHPARAIADFIASHGVPNFYGPQRFGRAMANIDHAVDLLSRPKAARGTRGGFMVSVLQSALFNLWLSQRVQRGDFQRILKGDLAKKTDTGGMFTVEDTVEAQARLDKGAIVYTGPIFGHKMMAAKDEAALWETRLLSDHHLTPADFKALRAPGSRRPAVLQIPDLEIHPVQEGLVFSFTLPAGAYATAVLREFTRNPVGEEGASDTDE